MGLMDRKKKDVDEKAEEIGGVVPPSESSYATGSVASDVHGEEAAAVPEASPGPDASETGSKPAANDDEEGSSLDIFTEEAAASEDNKLADKLPDVDVYDLLRECQEVAAELFGGDYTGSSAYDQYGYADADSIDLDFI